MNDITKLKEKKDGSYLASPKDIGDYASVMFSKSYRGPGINIWIENIEGRI